MAEQITWIRKPGGSKNSATHITEVGGPGWSRSAADAIHDILNNRDSYYVVAGGQTAWVGVGTHEGHYYLRTQSDGTPLDNLLSLTNLDG